MKKESSKAGSFKIEANRDSQNLSRIMPVVYDELRRLARHYMQRERAGQTLQATALVNEAYLRLMKEKAHGWKNRAHFCAIAANSMREILVERARSRAALKRKGSRIQVSFNEAMLTEREKPLDLLTLNEALDRLAELDPKLARIVELRFFGGLNIEELARELELSPASVKRKWAMARAWLKGEMEKTHGS